MPIKKPTHPSIQINHNTKQMLDKLAEVEGTTKSGIVARAVEHYWYERMLQRANDEWTAAMADAEAAADALAEDSLWAEADTSAIEDSER